MRPTKDGLAAVLAIGHAVSARGEGLSLPDALSRAGYVSRRPGLKARDLVPLIRADPSLVEQWCAYSEDKRTSGGWYLTREGQIGTVEPPVQLLDFGSLEEAVAEYVVRELDFWAGV